MRTVDKKEFAVVVGGLLRLVGVEMWFGMVGLWFVFDVDGIVFKSSENRIMRKFKHNQPPNEITG